MEKHWLIDIPAPEIIVLDHSMDMVGLSIRTDPKNIYKDAVILGKQYSGIKQKGLIQNKHEPWAFVAISRNFSKDGSWEYLIGDVVKDFSVVPQGLVACEIPSGCYVRFLFQPRIAALWGPAMGIMKKFIYTEWLPNSEYEVSGQSVGEFEYHDARSLSKKPLIELYVSIRQKMGITQS